jgi:hypothetical protein
MKNTLEHSLRHERFADYAVNEPLPYICVRGKLREARFLGKSLISALVEYRIKSKHALLIIPIDDNVIHPSEQIRISYNIIRWKNEEHFALIENSALNNGVWCGGITLHETYNTLRTSRATVVSRNTRQGKLRDWAIGLVQPQLPGFEAYARICESR